MKSMYKIGLLVILTALCTDSVAGKWDVVKKRVIEKSYKTNGSETLSIDNSFGKVHVNTWNEKNISVKIEIIARRRNEERAQETLDKIDIDISESSTKYSFETDINGQMNNQNSEGFEINYTINMPSGNPIEIKNSFGDTYIADRSGTNTLKISYGELKFGRLSGESDIKISFSDGSIERMERGELVIKYSDVDVEEIGVAKLHQEFSDVNVGKAVTLDMISKYGAMDIGEVQGLMGTVSFSGFRLGKLGVEIDLETAYSSNFRIEHIDKNFKTIKLQGKFGAFKLDFEEGTNALFEVNTKFCEFKYDAASVDMNYQVRGDLKGEFKGEMGNGSGGQISVTSSYGDVRFE